MTATPMNANQMVDRMTRVELDGDYAPDFRRLVREDRQRLMLAARKGDAEQIGDRMAECRELFRLWGVEL